MPNCPLHILDLPNEILFLILTKLNNMDVLYSLVDKDNQHLDTVAQHQTFTNNLNFVSIDSNENVSSVSDTILDRFCTSVLLRIHSNVKSLVLEPTSMERILCVTNYPQLTKLKIFNIDQEIVSRYFTDDFLFRQVDKLQITDLTLLIDDDINGSYKEYMYLYAQSLILFENLMHLTILPSFPNNWTFFSLHNLSSTTFSSSTLTKLCIKVYYFASCLALLDGRLKQLTTFIVEVGSLDRDSPTMFNKSVLSSLTCFSFLCYHRIEQYDNKIVPLLQCMSGLEELTLYLQVKNRSTFIDGSHLHNEIFTYMPQLHSFTFHIYTESDIPPSTPQLFMDTLQRTFTNIGIQHMACIEGRYAYSESKVGYHVFSSPFKFDRLEYITNGFPDVIFNSVTYLEVVDRVPFKHAFFIRVTRSFPSLKYFTVRNLRRPFWEYVLPTPELIEKDWCSVVQYPHLTSLSIDIVDIHYVQHFLNETKTHLPRLTELKIEYNQLETVTKNFTRDETRKNCANVKRLYSEDVIVRSKELYSYFPSLSM